ncbi:protein kinase domain-containing protein [Paractinoplanes globisporus]|uniref:non-specific serine/threonine protein kinase n=1 Tax=Paractinoplanes globisporus TaxID=113565 RepID=A0ABW6WF42_9ACTN|nr:phosphotransferase [Actinoplanes globisporus]
MTESAITVDDGQPALIVRYGQLLGDEIPQAQRAGQLADILVELVTGIGLTARRAAPVLGPHPAVALHVNGVPYLVVVSWSPDQATPAQILDLQRAAARPGVRLVLVSISGFTEPQLSHAEDEPVVILMDRFHIEAMLCGLASVDGIFGQASDRALFDRAGYTDLTDLLVDTGRPTPAGFVTPDRLPAPGDMCVQAADGARVRHLFSGVAGWIEPLGLAITEDGRLLVTTAAGIVEVDGKRGTTDWLLPLDGCRGDPLPCGDGSVLTLCGPAVVAWKDGKLTPIAGDLSDARSLLAGPGADPWVLSGYGASFGVGTGTLALTRLGRRAGQQQKRHIVFGADVLTAGWLGDLRFFLAAAGHSAVIDLARSTRVQREDWIESPHHSPGHLLVTGPSEVTTASPDSRGVDATLYRTDLATGASELVAEIASNKVRGLAWQGADSPMLMLGDVRGNDVTTPHPVIVAIDRQISAATSSHPVQPRNQTPVDPVRERSAATSKDAAPMSDPHEPAVIDHPIVDRFDPVRIAARGLRSDYRLGPRPLARGGQATVFGAVHKPTGTPVAFKKVNFQGPDQLARMGREVDAAQMFGGNPHVMPVLDFSPSYEWIVMPLADDTAQTRSAELADSDRLRRLVTAICTALREPHKHGWIHRDLKPDNILRLDDRWTVADWGLGRRPRGQTTDPKRTQVGGPFGTEGFAAPELGADAHSVGPQADIYSIGQIAGWALTGNWPQANVALLPLTGPWRTIVKAATDFNPARRPGTVDELLALIAQELDEPPDIPVNQGKALLAAAAGGDATALTQLIRLAVRSHADYELYLDVLVDLDEEQTRTAVSADPSATRDVVRAVRDLHTGGQITLEYDDVDRLVTWLLVIAQQAEILEEWDLLEDTAEAILYLDLWDRWNVQNDIKRWITYRTGQAASIVAGALRRNPEVLQHFASLASNTRVDHRVRTAIRKS